MMYQRFPKWIMKILQPLAGLWKKKGAEESRTDTLITDPNPPVKQQVPALTGPGSVGTTAWLQ